MATKKDVVVKEETGVTNVIPDFMKGMHGQGTEALSQDAIQPPRIKLMQAISPELEEFDDLKAGDWLNTITGQNYGPVVRVIPCYLTEAYFLFAPRVKGSSGGLLARANDGVHWNPANKEFEVQIDNKGTKTIWRTADTVAKSGLATWGTSDPDDKSSTPAATHAINCMLLLPDYLDDGPAVASFMRSALKVGKKFAGNLKLSRVPAFGRVFEFSSAKVDGAEGPYLEPRVKAAGFVADEQVFAMAKDLYDAAKDRGLAVDIGDETEASSGASGDDSDANY